MARVQIVTDSLADIPQAVASELGIHVVPAIIHFGEQSFRDKVELDTTEFYQRLTASPVLPTTSQPPPGVFEELYTRLALESDSIVSIHSTSRLTGIYSSALTASQAVSDARVVVVDSRQVSMALGWLVIIAARAARAGASVEEIQQDVYDAIPRSHIFAALDTLEYARRGGRLGRAQVLIGTLLNVKPILSLENGEVEPIGKVRTLHRALERLVDIVAELGPVAELAVAHAAGRALAEELKGMLAARLSKPDILITEAGPVLGAHVGPNAVGACWITRKL